MEQKTGHWFLLHRNQQAGVNTFCTCQPSPPFIPRPQKCNTCSVVRSLIHVSYTRTGDLLCHRQTGHVSTGGGGRLNTHFPFLSVTWALHWEATALADRAPPRKDCIPGPHMWHHCNLLCLSCGTQQQSQASQTKATECCGILWGE